MTPTIYIDADACPVRDEAFKVAERHAAKVFVVSNSYIRVPPNPLISTKVVSDGFDAADDWIAEQANNKSIVITADILLAQRCLLVEAKCIAPNGKVWTEDNIGSAIATRAIMADLRAGADMPNMGGPPPFQAKDRSNFLQNLHETVVKMKRAG